MKTLNIPSERANTFQNICEHFLGSQKSAIKPSIPIAQYTHSLYSVRFPPLIEAGVSEGIFLDPQLIIFFISDKPRRANAYQPGSICGQYSSLHHLEIRHTCLPTAAEFRRLNCGLLAEISSFTKSKFLLMYPVSSLI